MLLPRALEFAILTAARTSEVLGATWSEIDLDARLWTIPAERMKAGREHRVPLGNRAVEIIRNMMTTKQNDYIFYGDRRATLSNMSLLMLLRRMGRNDITTHGFRSSFRDWTAEQTNCPSAAAEIALAHSVGNAVEAAYRRKDMLYKRRLLMARWENYCARPVVHCTVPPIRVGRTPSAPAYLAE